MVIKYLKVLVVLFHNPYLPSFPPPTRPLSGIEIYLMSKEREKDPFVFFILNKDTSYSPRDDILNLSSFEYFI